MDKKEDLQKYIEKRIRESKIGVPTLEEINGFVGEWMQLENRRPISDFDGYSPTQMQYIIHNLFGGNCPVQLADCVDEDCNAVPLFRQVKRLMEIIEKEENLKLTQTGNLPPRIVKEVYSVGATEPYIEGGIVKLRTEKDSVSVQMARIAVELMRTVKKRNNFLSLTKKGKELKMDNRKLLSDLLTVMFTKFNIAYFDTYSSENIGWLGLGFNLVLLHQYGKKEQKATFYADKYFKAFPLLLQEIDDLYRPLVEVAAHCYSYRIFSLLFYHFGLVTIDERDKYRPTHTQLIHKTPLFDKLFVIKPAR